ncbi:copper amine oxidase N-terminal domain-containing protein [Lysinibacillus boronitolerans]|uniref:copper amine oxidase N-terminal domain-containing protein n=1 Tax=Lysinibacillus boronitolerans TaxID=309788 RepID=UPI002161770C|nr:copper amine oxidase N-terminal domain-containing protein [Lysinibacillus boronitolerans]MCS1392434.1 copper amine oxidase N-terminal domain-containing protein [Lysinibacillus boronitolerans]
MKKLRFIIPLLFCLFLGLGINNASASEGVLIYINGEKQSFSNQAIVENGSTLVPLRGIFESLGANVQWNQSTQTIDASKGNTKVWLKIGSKNAKVNDSAVNLSVPAQVKNGKTLVPLRFISESLGANVQWNQKTQTVTITGDSNSGKTENEEKKVPTLKIGETFSDYQIEVTLKKVEYVDGVDKGFNVYLSVTNKSEKPLIYPGGLRFKINESKYEEELNRIGYSNHFDSKGYIYKGETTEGHYQYLFDKDISIKEIEYNTGIVNYPKSKWIVE